MTCLSIFGASPVKTRVWRNGDGSGRDPFTRFFFILTAGSRAGLRSGFIDRPLLLGLLYAFLVGNTPFVLPLAIFFELFWLDLFPIGGYLPPSPSFSYLMLLVLGFYFNWATPGEVIVPLALSLPFAYLTPLLEGWLRKQRNMWNSQVLKKSRGTAALGKSTGVILGQSLALTLALELLLWIASTVALGFFLSFIMNSSFHVQSPEASWGFLYLLGCTGAVLALRLRRAYLVFIFSFLILFIVPALV